MSRGVLNFESRDIAKIKYEININRENYTLIGSLNYRMYLSFLWVSRFLTQTLLCLSQLKVPERSILLVYKHCVSAHLPRQHQVEHQVFVSSRLLQSTWNAKMQLIYVLQFCTSYTHIFTLNCIDTLSSQIYLESHSFRAFVVRKTSSLLVPWATASCSHLATSLRLLPE